MTGGGAGSGEAAGLIPRINAELFGRLAARDAGGDDGVKRESLVLCRRARCCCCGGV
jgi:hypothetical protein